MKACEPFNQNDQSTSLQLAPETCAHTESLITRSLQGRTLYECVHAHDGVHIWVNRAYPSPHSGGEGSITP